MSERQNEINRKMRVIENGRERVIYVDRQTDRCIDIQIQNEMDRYRDREKENESDMDREIERMREKSQ